MKKIPWIKTPAIPITLGDDYILLNGTTRIILADICLRDLFAKIFSDFNIVFKKEAGETKITISTRTK